MLFHSLELQLPTYLEVRKGQRDDDGSIARQPVTSGFLRRALYVIPQALFAGLWLRKKLITLHLLTKAIAREKIVRVTGYALVNQPRRRRVL